MDNIPHVISSMWDPQGSIPTILLINRCVRVQVDMCCEVGCPQYVEDIQLCLL